MGKEQKRYSVEVRVPECPASYVTADSWALLDLVAPALEAQAACGMALADVLPLVRKDARVLDACMAVKRAEAMRKAAMVRGVWK